MIRRADRRAFTLIEIIIAMMISLIVTGVIFFSFVATMGNTQQGVEMLEFVRRGTLILEYLKQDIRAATKASDSVSPGEGSVKIHRVRNKKEEDVTYTYDSGRKIVVRKGGDGRQQEFGIVGGEGRIFSFEVKPVEQAPGFYRVNVEFLPPPRKKTPGAAQPDAAQRASTPYPFKILVNKRSTEDSDRDVRWNYAFEGAPPQ